VLINFQKMNSEEYQRRKQTDLDFIIKRKIISARLNDSKAGRGNAYKMDDYITLQWVKDTIAKQDQACFHCGKMLKLIGFERYEQNQFSIDRLYSDMPHEQENCVISCLRCNLEHGSKDAC